MAIEIRDQVLYDLRELRDKMGIGVPTLRRLIREGKLRGNKIGRKLTVWGEDLRAYINAQGRGNLTGYGKTRPVEKPQKRKK